MRRLARAVASSPTGTTVGIFCPGHSKAAAVIQAIVSLGHAMSLTVTAEGVETEIQKNFLEQAGCDEMQGYLFSKPVWPGEITKLVRGVLTDIH